MSKDEDKIERLVMDMLDVNKYIAQDAPGWIWNLAEHLVERGWCKGGTDETA